MSGKKSKVLEMISLATCNEPGCNNQAVGLKRLSNNLQAAVCEDHLE